MGRTVLIVDDHARFRGLARRLLQDLGFDVVGEAATAEECVRSVRKLSPDVVLLDIQLPDRDGFAVADTLLALPTPPRIVMISNRDARDYGGRVERSGAIAFIAKGDLSVESLLAVLSG